MKRVSVVVVIALLNALLFGVTGTASAVQTGVQDPETVRQRAIANSARAIGPGAPVRVERMDGTRIEGLFDRVNNDGDIEILVVSKDHRETVIIPVGLVRRVTPLGGRALGSFVKKTGVTKEKILAGAAVGGLILLGACVGLSRSVR